MNVLVLIDGREAIPVRAIPLLTNWEVLSPDVVAEVLAGDSDFFHVFNGLTAHRVERDQVKAIASSFWDNFVVRDLRALSDRTRQDEVTHEDGHSQWRRESIGLLPAGAFVWRNEFEPRFWAMHGPEGETVVRATVDGGFELATRSEDIELDFDPFIPSSDVARLVMEGFESPDFVSKLAPSGYGLVVPAAEHEAPPTGVQKLAQDVEPEKAVSQSTDGAELPSDTGAEPVAADVQAPPKRHVYRQREQAELILREIHAVGLNPLELPANRPGRAGARKQIRERLEGKHHLFPEGSTVFNKAWEGLQARGEIAQRKS